MITEAFYWLLSFPALAVFTILDLVISTYNHTIIVTVGIFVVMALVALFEDMLIRATKETFHNTKTFKVICALLLAYVVSGGAAAVAIYESVAYIEHIEKKKGIEI
jgi:nitrate reductase gamma subunit